MAAQKSTASQKPRTSKQTKPGGKRIKPGGKIAPKRLTSAEPFGIVADGSIVATAAALGDGLEKLRDIPRGDLVRVLCTNDLAVQEAQREAARREFLRMTNPLAGKLVARHQADVDAVAEQIASVAELCEPFGQSYKRKFGGMRRSTDRECKLASLGTAKSFDIDITGDIAAQVVEKLTAYAQQLRNAAERVKAAMDAGTIAKPKAARRGKAVTA